MHSHELMGLCELEWAKPRGCSSGAYFLRLGPKVEGFYASIHNQVDSGKFMHPRYKNLCTLRRQLRTVVRGRDSPVPLTFSSDESSDEEAEGTASDEDAVSTRDSGEDIGSDFPLIRKLGINLDLSDAKNSDFMKDLIGELLALQLQHSPEKSQATNVYNRYKTTHTVYALSILPHASESAFKVYHRKVLYFEEMFKIISLCPDSTGPSRVATYIAKKYPEQYVSVGKKNGFL